MDIADPEPTTTEGAHTYRDGESVAARPVRAVRRILLPLAVIPVLVVAAGEMSWADAAGFVGLVVVVVLTTVATLARDRCCIRIRLSDDGELELETRRAVMRLHAGQVRSVVHRRSSGAAPTATPSPIASTSTAEASGWRSR